LIATVACIAGIILSTVMIGHCTTGSVRNTNATGALSYQSNPYNYEVGQLVGGAILGTGHNEYTAIIVQPYKTYSLYTEELLLCGNEADRLNGRPGPIILTYERVDHRMFEGVGCHRLVDVMDVKAESAKGVK